jgi:hypothetical protein
LNENYWAKPEASHQSSIFSGGLKIFLYEHKKVQKIQKKSFSNPNFQNFIFNFEIEYKTNEWSKNSENLDLRRFLKVLSGKNIKSTYILFCSKL